MSGIESTADTVKRGVDLISEGLRALESGPFDFYLGQLIAAHKLVVERFAPFKIGETVELAKVPDFEKAIGWCGCEHFLVVGAVGRVTGIEIYADGTIYFDVFFDGQSIIWRGVEKPISSKHAFRFPEDSLHPSSRKLP